MDSVSQDPDLSQQLHESLRISNDELRSRSMETDAILINLNHQIDDEALTTVQETSCEGDIKLHQVEFSPKEGEVELRDNEIRVFSLSLDSVKECVSRVLEIIDEEKSEKSGEIVELNAGDMDFDSVYKVAVKLESRLKEYVEMRRKEKRELENTVVSLTEENRDVNSLLRIALVEKEAVEKEISRLNKGAGGGDQKRVALLQFAERGLQKVGFGFMIGTGSSSTDETDNDSGSATCDSVGGEEEVVSLASTVEKIMKNLRLEITQLKQSLEESRSDNERLQSLTEKQAQKITECTSYINDLEERESRLAQNIEQLMMEITGAQEEVERWREACELEVKAGKHVIEEHERQAVILEEELNKAKGSLDTLNNKLKLKEQLAAAAIAAQEAAQKSIEVADRRAAELQERIEELTRQLEAAESRGEQKIRRKVRHMCWPWRALIVNPGGPRSRNARRMVPEMQGLLHYRI